MSVPLTCHGNLMVVAESNANVGGRRHTTSFLSDMRVVLVTDSEAIAPHVNVEAMLKGHHLSLAGANKGLWGWRHWGRGKGGREEGAPANVLAYGPPNHWARWTYTAESIILVYNVTQNNSGVGDPQYLSDFSVSWQKLGKNRPEPARQP